MILRKIFGCKPILLVNIWSYFYFELIGKFFPLFSNVIFQNKNHQIGTRNGKCFSQCYHVIFKLCLQSNQPSMIDLIQYLNFLVLKLHFSQNVLLSSTFYSRTIKHESAIPAMFFSFPKHAQYIHGIYFAEKSGFLAIPCCSK